MTTLVTFYVTLGLSACTKKGHVTTTSMNTPTVMPSPVSARTATTEIEIKAMPTALAFDKTRLEVKSGSIVTLHFINNATNPPLTHNWVLVKPGRAQAIASAGAKAGEANQYIPNSQDILAHSGLAKPGHEAAATFMAPPPGDYPYLCTVPGSRPHSGAMNGVLKSVP